MEVSKHIYLNWYNRTIINDYYGACQTFKRSQSFILEKDEPPILLGEDHGANPVEYALAALDGCLTTSVVYHAAAQGIKIDKVETSFSGDIDLHGFLGLDENIRNGYEKIKVTFKIKSDAPEKKLQELVPACTKEITSLRYHFTSNAGRSYFGKKIKSKNQSYVENEK